MWVSNVIPGGYIVLERDTQIIIHSFLNALDNNCHPLLRDIWFLKSLFTQILVQYIWREGFICADFMANKDSMMYSIIV